MILVFYAFARELKALRRRIGARAPLRIEGLRGFLGELGGLEIIAVATGIGYQRAQETARRALEKVPGVTMVISTGVAGGLSEGLSAGDLVIAERIVWSDDEETSDPARIVALRPEQVRNAERALKAAGLKFSTGTVLTSRRVLATAAEKRHAKRRTGAIAIDMESAALAAEALSRDIPFACVRAVMDTVEDELFGWGLADDQGRVRPLAAAFYLVRNPAVMLRLPRIMRNLAAASRSLAAAIEALSRHSAQ
ncbi:MAG: hypothetical protein WA005_04515 [Candidatus Binataceae bacterium]